MVESAVISSSFFRFMCNFSSCAEYFGCFLYVLKEFE